MRQQSNDTGEAAAIPITVRQLEAIVRLSEALAKMKLYVFDNLLKVLLMAHTRFLLIIR